MPFHALELLLQLPVQQLGGLQIVDLRLERVVARRERRQLREVREEVRHGPYDARDGILQGRDRAVDGAAGRRQGPSSPAR